MTFNRSLQGGRRPEWARCVIVACVLATGWTAGVSFARDFSAPSATVVVDEPIAVEARIEAARLSLRGGDFDAARRTFRELASEGNARALGYLGEMVEFGLGEARDPKGALPLYQRSSDAGDMESRGRLGLRLLREGGATIALMDSSKSSVTLGVSLVESSAAAGDAYGQYAWGLLHLEGLWVPRDDELGVKFIELAAQQGSIDAQSLLGRMYAQGRGVQRHEAMAQLFLTEAARQGELSAMTLLGSMYLSGDGVERDPQESLYWLEKAAERNHPPAMGQLAVMLSEGKDVRGDLDRAMTLWRDAALLGDAPSRFHYGVGLLEGRGTPRNTEAGMRWIESSAQQGFLEAKRFLSEKQH